MKSNRISVDGVKFLPAIIDGNVDVLQNPNFIIVKRRYLIFMHIKTLTADICMSLGIYVCIMYTLCKWSVRNLQDITVNTSVLYLIYII
jgi:hypothetical protein